MNIQTKKCIFLSAAAQSDSREITEKLEAQDISSSTNTNNNHKQNTKFCENKFFTLSRVSMAAIAFSKSLHASSGLPNSLNTTPLAEDNVYLSVNPLSSAKLKSTNAFEKGKKK